MMQTITVTLAVPPGPVSYEVVEQRSAAPYEALEHFFSDIRYRVTTITIAMGQEAPAEDRGSAATTPGKP